MAEDLRQEQAHTRLLKQDYELNELQLLVQQLKAEYDRVENSDTKEAERIRQYRKIGQLSS